jgi:hypothetical protein
MNITLQEISVRELTKGYTDNQEGGVTGYGGKLDIRPPFQREFVYDDKKRAAVIDTLYKGFPLNVMYWAEKEDGNFEIIDGQQRTISICEFVQGKFSFLFKDIHDRPMYYHNLREDIRERLLDYKLTVYQCSGSDTEKLDWFKTINIAGEKLTDQELRNAVYSGSWVTDAKRYFSRRNGPAYAVGGDYLTGSAIRQDYFETTIKWINNGDIDGYMATHQNDENATPLWNYFRAVIGWIERTFTVKRKKEMKGVDWGTLYNTYKDELYDTDKLEKEIAALMMDDDVTAKKGIYPYVLTRNEKYLNIRAFTEAMKRKKYEEQGRKCAIRGKEYDISEMEADHIVPWHSGGKTDLENLQMIHRDENRAKSGR